MAYGKEKNEEGGSKIRKRQRRSDKKCEAQRKKRHADRQTGTLHKENLRTFRPGID